MDRDTCHRFIEALGRSGAQPADLSVVQQCAEFRMAVREARRRDRGHVCDLCLAAWTALGAGTHVELVCNCIYCVDCLAHRTDEVVALHDRERTVEKEAEIIPCLDVGELLAKLGAALREKAPTTEEDTLRTYLAAKHLSRNAFYGWELNDRQKCVTLGAPLVPFDTEDRVLAARLYRKAAQGIGMAADRARGLFDGRD